MYIVVLAATKYASDLDEAKAKMDGFIREKEFDEKTGYEAPTVISAKRSRIDQYGWLATCPEWQIEYCINRLHPTNPNALLTERCTNISEHPENKVKYLKGDNPIIAKITQCT
jgi:hypothetical protein